MAWSIFTDGGGKNTAKQWAESLLTGIGAPVTPDNVQVVYDWEVSEGGGGKYNPLNQGPVPGHPELTTTGQQYGGGAADYASWQAGLTGAVDYLNMQSYVAVKQALKAGDATGARAAIIASPWAGSHYGGGSAFSHESLPNGGAVDADFGVPTPWGTIDVPSPGQTVSALAGSFNPFKWLADLFKTDFKDLTERFALIVLGFGILIIGILRFTEAGQSFTSKIGKRMSDSTGGALSGDSEESKPEKVEKEGEKVAKKAEKAPGTAVKKSTQAHEQGLKAAGGAVKETAGKVGV